MMAKARIVLVQEINVTWTKASRDAAGASLRRTAPEALNVPSVPDTVEEPVYIHHRVGYDEQNRFQAPLTSDVRLEPAAHALHAHNLTVAYGDDAVRVDLSWSWGAPMRHPIWGILHLSAHEWGRVRFNERGGLYDNPWHYSLYVFNIGLFTVPDPNVFLKTQPTKTYENMAKLW